MPNKTTKTDNPYNPVLTMTHLAPTTPLLFISLSFQIVHTLPDVITSIHIVSSLISERCREKRREASRRSMQRASCHSHMGKQNIITREIMILVTWFIEQKVTHFRCRSDTLDQPAGPETARPGPVMTLFYGLFLKSVKRYELETFT